jgi:hypothetical protein
LPPIGLGDVVAARTDVESLEFSVGTVVEFRDGDVVVRFETIDDETREPVARFLGTSRRGVSVVASGDVLRFISSLEDDESKVIALTVTNDDEPNRANFLCLIADCERQILNSEVDRITLRAFDEFGLGVQFGNNNSTLFNAWLRGEPFRCLSDVVKMYQTCIVDPQQSSLRHKARLLHIFHRMGAILICLAEFVDQTDLLSTTVRARWFVSAQLNAATMHLEIANDIITTVVNRKRREVAMVAIADAVADAMFTAGRTQDLEHLRTQLYVGLAAGESARETCLLHGWNWPLLSLRLLFVRDLFWELRIDEMPMAEGLLNLYVQSQIVDVRERLYDIPSDEYVFLLRKFYMTEGDLATEKSRRLTTQKLTNQHATLQAAKEFVEHYYIEIGHPRTINRSTIYRRLTSKHSKGSEAARHGNFVLDIRPILSGRGDVDEKCDTHFSLALMRTVRELIGNESQRVMSTMRFDRIWPAMLISRDCKAKIYLDHEPVGKPKPQWHLIRHDDDSGRALRAKPILATISSDQLASRTVVSHAFLTHNRGANEPNSGAPRGVLSHGSLRRSAPLHAVEIFLHMESFYNLWLDASGVLQKRYVFISDRGPRENLIRLQVQLCYRLVMYALGIEMIVLISPAVSSYNPVEHVHQAASRVLGSTPIGKRLTTNGDVLAVADRLRPARWGGEFVLNALLLDGAVAKWLPEGFEVFCRGNMASAKGPAKSAARQLNNTPIVLPAALLELRRTFALIGTPGPMTFGQLLAAANDGACNFVSTYFVVSSTAPLTVEACMPVLMPIPRHLVRGNSDVTARLAMRVTDDSYLTAGESFVLSRCAGVTVECPDGNVRPLTDVLKTPDTFLPRMILDNYFRNTPRDELFNAVGIARLKRLTMLGSEMIKAEIEHRVAVAIGRVSASAKRKATNVAKADNQ